MKHFLLISFTVHPILPGQIFTRLMSTIFMILVSQINNYFLCIMQGFLSTNFMLAL